MTDVPDIPDLPPGFTLIHIQKNFEAWNWVYKGKGFMYVRAASFNLQMAVEDIWDFYTKHIIGKENVN